MRRALKNNKGVTLMSVIIYITIMFVVLAAIMRITIYFSDNMSEAADVSFETEFNKINIYLLDEAKKTGNNISKINTDGTQITFSKGNKYTYNAEVKTIYLNDNIKVCENVESCVFEKEIAENGKNILALTIKINNIEKTVNYVIAGGNATSNNVLLPSQYQQVEYIQSTGTQYIDTGVTPTLTTGFVLDLIILDEINSSGKRLFGSSYRNNGSWGGIMLATYNSFEGGQLKYGETSIDPKLISNNRMQINFINKHYTSSTGANVYFTDTTLQPYGPIYIFNVNTDSSTTTFSSAMLYSAKIYEEDLLVRDFIPCYRKADGVIGLYDSVNDVFYTNAGTGTFEKGDDVIVEADSGNQVYINEEDYIFNMEGENSTEESLLPATYQQVEYIESSGTQYIDTGVNSNSNIKLQTSINGNYDSSAWYGGRTGNYIGIYNYNGRFDWTGITGENKSIVVNPSNNEWHDISHGKELIIDNQLIIEYEETDYTTDFNIYLFAGNNNGTVFNYSSIKMKETIIYENDTLVRDFIPCYRKSDGVAGLYDTVNDVFYTNAGTGTFTTGPNAN